MRYVSGVDDAGNAIDIRDPLAEKIQALVKNSNDDNRVATLLTLQEIFGNDLPANPQFVQAVSLAWQNLAQQGARQALLTALNS